MSNDEPANTCRPSGSFTERAFASLKMPPMRVSFTDRGMPSSGVLERAYYSTPDRLAVVMQRLIAGDRIAVDEPALVVPS